MQRAVQDHDQNRYFVCRCCPQNLPSPERVIVALFEARGGKQEPTVWNHLCISCVQRLIGLLKKAVVKDPWHCNLCQKYTLDHDAEHLMVLMRQGTHRFSFCQPCSADVFHLLGAPRDGR